MIWKLLFPWKNRHDEGVETLILSTATKHTEKEEKLRQQLRPTTSSNSLVGNFKLDL